MRRCEPLRYSTTVGTNALIERTGPKLGLITTAGFEDTIFIGRSRSWADGKPMDENRDLARIRKPEPLIVPDMVVGMSRRMDCYGKVVKPLAGRTCWKNCTYWWTRRHGLCRQPAMVFRQSGA